MSESPNAAPTFARTRAFYVGLNKVADSYVPGDHLAPSRSYEAHAKARGGAALSPAGPVAGAGLVGAIEAGLTGAPISDLSDRGQLLAIAPQIFAEVASESKLATADTSFEVGRIYHYNGPVRFRVRTHDDFREEGAHEEAPRLVLWLVEIPDDEPADQTASVTWVVLSGTAQGQLKTQLGGRVSDWRGGSQTEHLFETLIAKMNRRDRRKSDDRWLQDPYYALAARNLLSDSTEQHVETLFTCLDVHVCPTEGEHREVSFLGWGQPPPDVKQSSVG